MLDTRYAPAAALALLAVLSAAAAGAQPIVRVPGDAPDLTSAIGQVPNGGIIELAAGTYAAPQNGFRIRFVGKDFTIRAAAGAEVVLSGEGSHTIMLIEDGPLRQIVLEDLIFDDGAGTQDGEAGAVTVIGARAIFRRATLRNNRAPAPPAASTGGGAVRLSGGADGRFDDCIWHDNSAQTRGGALAVVGASAILRRNQLFDNRADIADGVAGAPVNVVGGAIYVLDAKIRVERTRFSGNRAAWVGGALYAFGTWSVPEEVPATDVTVVGSTFVNNQAMNVAASAQPPGVSGGGALHVEDHVTLRVYSSRFEDNHSQWAGAINAYRTVVEVHDSVFRGNSADVDGFFGLPAAGGAINQTSADFNDPSTAFGAINRRPASMRITGSFFQGRHGGTTTTAHQGGCIFSDGDRNRLLGNDALNVPQDGGLSDNRAQLEIHDSVFFDCDVEVPSFNVGMGGAIFANLTELELEDSLVIESDALLDGALGGGVAILGRSRAVIDGTTFARNSAEGSGGALHVTGSQLEVDDCTFLENEVSPGVAEGVLQSTGAAIFSIPQGSDDGSPFSRDVTGVVEDSFFLDNVGLPIREGDNDDGPINDLRYDGNSFRNTTFGNDVFVNRLDFASRTVPALNNLVINRADGSSTKKSQVANVLLFSTPDTGMALAAPPSIFTVNASGDDPPPTTAFVGYAWSGSNATLGGVPLPDRAGVVEVTTAGSHKLVVDGVERDDAPVGQSDGLVACHPDEQTLCLNDGRFRVEFDFRFRNGTTGAARAVPFGTVDSGLFFFFNPNNWEMLVKVLDNCNGPTNRFWVLAAATTNVEYTLRVTDAATGEMKSYFNPLGTASPAVVDTDAFATCDALPPPAARPAARLSAAGPGIVRTAGRVKAGGACVPSPTSMCLNQGRFIVELDFRFRNGTTGAAQVVDGGTVDSGLFFFTNPDNWEMLVKVLDNCSGPTNRLWVFAAATTNVEYTLRVTDAETGTVKEYFNPLGNRAAAITDTDAFATCP
ncbi:MAG: hypothetical protein D6696_16660 [Acidobacteria bacterium]|nr:MAG: hypothetical protein D6696_16660 [Acidobacteriota bacterium]